MKFIKAGSKLLLMSLATSMTTSPAASAPNFNPFPVPAGWVSSPTLTAPTVGPSFDVTSGKVHVFSAIFNEDSWTGDIRANPIRADGTVQSSAKPSGWESPAKRLDSREPGSRLIVTLADGQGVPFRVDTLSRKWMNKLGANQSEAARMVRYIRGDRSLEGSQGFRSRHSILEPIIHSNIHYWSHTAAPGKPEMIYVGSQSGMLHAFDALTGEEVFAYIPSILMDTLPRLAKRAAKETAFVDGQISIARVETDEGEKTILVGTLGSGGKGLYALDISNPKATNEKQVAAKVLWEVTQSERFPNLGHVYGRAQIARLKSGKLVAITGNGYGGGIKQRSVLYVIDLLSGKKLDQIIVADKAEKGSSGLSTPTLLDTSANSHPDLAYAGDIDGVLWKFDLVNSTASKLFEAPKGRSITTAPLVVKHPLNGHMVVFGTGRGLTSADHNKQSQEAIHGVWDGAPKRNKKTLVQEFLGEKVIDNQRYRAVSSKQPDWTIHSGWRTVLPKGERVIGETPILNDNRYYFRSTDPSQKRQENWLNELNMLSGGSNACPIFDIDRDGDFCGTTGDKPDRQDVIKADQLPASKQLPNGLSSQPVLITITRDGELYNSTLYNLLSKGAKQEVNPGNSRSDRSTTPGEPVNTTPKFINRPGKGLGFMEKNEKSEFVCSQNCTRSAIVDASGAPLEKPTNNGPVLRNESWMEIKEWY